MLEDQLAGNSVSTSGAHDRTILLVEGDPNDELLTLHALKKANVKNEVVVARDGEEALDYLFAEGAYADREAGAVPQLVLVEPKLAKVDGFEFIERLRADERTRRLPVAVFASSDEEQDLLKKRGLGAVTYIRKPLDFGELSGVLRCAELYWLVLDGA